LTINQPPWTDGGRPSHLPNLEEAVGFFIRINGKREEFLMAFDFKGTRLEDAPDEVIPICPNCKERLDIIWRKSHVKMIRREIIMCPHCKVLLGYAASTA